MPHLRLFLLGPPRIELDGESVDISRRKAIAILAYLAVTGQEHSRDSLATLLWPESDQSRARGALRRTLSVLNRTLAGGWLDAERETVDLKREGDLWIDVEQFRQLIAGCDLDAEPNAEDCLACVSPLTEAVTLYHDDFMVGFTLRDSPDFDEWQFFQAESLRRELAETLEWLVRCHSLRSEHEQALSFARRWLAVDPLREAAHRALMTLYAQTDQRAAALRQYQEAERVLEEEIGVPPSAETTALYERIRAGELESQRAHRQTATVSPAPSLIRTPAFLGSDIRPRETDGPTFVARERELAQMHGYLEATLGGQGQVIFVTGEAGTGKTALVQEFSRQAQESVADLVVASGTCSAHTGAGDPYLPFREILALLTGDIETSWKRGLITRENANRLWNLLPQTVQVLKEFGPDLIDTFISGPALAVRVAARSELLAQSIQPPAGGNGAGQVGQSDLFEQYTRVLLALARQRPLLLVIDDAQWADVASINLLFHLGRWLSGAPVLLIITYRRGDIALGPASPPSQRPDSEEHRHPLEPVINELSRTYGDVFIDLDRALGRDFVEALLDIYPNRLGPEFRAALYRQTQGHPLFTVELLRDMQERGDLVRDEQGRWVEGSALDWKTLPTRVEAVIKERIDRLKPELRDLLAVASVEGEIFTAQVVATVQGLGERTMLRHLSHELEARHRLVREQGEIRVDGQFLSRYQFAHALFQQYLYDSLGAGERRLLHGEIATILESLYKEKTNEVAVQLARHYVEAGQREKAIGYLLQAGDRARDLYAHQEAVGFYEQALDFLKALGAYDRAARTLMKLGLTHHLAFDFQQARRAYAEGFALWQRAGANRPSSLPAEPHALRITRSSPLTLDQAKAGEDSSIIFIDQLFSGLLELSPELDVVPDLAERWEVLEAGGKYVFHLREDVHWSDGVPVTAEDFVYSWRRVLHPTAKLTVASFLFDIKGARAYHQGDLSDPEQIGVQALDETTLVVELEGPTSYFLQLVTQAMFYPVPGHVIAVHGENWTDLDHIVTNGPFKIAAWQPGKSIILERNPNYRGRFAGNVEQIEVLLDIPPVDRLRIYEADRLDITTLWPSPSAEDEGFIQQHPDEYLSGPILRTQYVGFNIGQAPFDDGRVRRAFALAIDNEQLARVILSGYHFPALGGFIPLGMPGHSPNIGLPYDPERARRLLAEAGYGGEHDFPAVEFQITADNATLADYLTTQWREGLGIDVRVQIVDWEILYNNFETSPSDLFMIGWSADYPDPDNFLRVSTYINRVKWLNTRYAELVENARRVTNQQERLKMYQAADRILIEEAAMIPVLYGRRHLLLKPWVSRYPTSAINVHFWKDVVIEPH